MHDIECFMLDRTNLFREELRRYTFSKYDPNDPKAPMDCAHGYHDASVVICAAREVPEVEEKMEGGDASCFKIHLPHDDPRWPVNCEKCGHVFQPADQWQHHFHRLHRLPDGSLRAIRFGELPPGAMFHSDWWPHPSPCDGHCLSVVLPPDGHIWQVEATANNCTAPNKGAGDPRHFCWCRHKNPDGTFTVDKTPEPGCNTCSAGGGSILTPKWHGFLRNGRLVQA